MGLAILIGLVVAAVAVLVLLDRRRKEARVEREDASAVEYINLFIGTLYMVLLSLIVVLLWQNVSDVSSDVRTEASGLQALAQTAQRLPSAEGGPLLKAAHEYAATVLNSEWPPKPGTGNGADENAPAARILADARAAVTHPVAAGATAGTVEDQAITEINTVADARDDRLAKSGSGIPDVLLIALAVLSLITIATPLALGLRADALAFAGFVVTTALVCLAFWFVVELQSPFHGLIHASPQPLRDVLAASA
jgi:hydrogenase-4 membrane subunit HyfE